MKLFNPAMLVFLPLKLHDFKNLWTAVKCFFELGSAENRIFHQVLSVTFIYVTTLECIVLGFVNALSCTASLNSLPENYILYIAFWRKMLDIKSFTSLNLIT